MQIKSDNNKGWSECPTDVLMVIFELLDCKSLLSCMAVNIWWRDAVDYIVEHRGKWSSLAQEGITNEGVTYKRKSCLSLKWRDLFVNSVLWHYVKEARITCNQMNSVDNIKSIHVYKDYLMIVHGTELTMKCYKIDCLIKQSTPANEENAMPGLVAQEDCLEAENRMILKLIQHGPFNRMIVFDDDCYYVLDNRNILRLYQWDEKEDMWHDMTLARYYGCKSSISDIHVSHNDVYVLLNRGFVLRLDREGRNFERLHGLDFPMHNLTYFTRLVYGNSPNKSIDRVFELEMPNYSVERKILFHKFSAVVAVPADKQFKLVRHPNSEHVVIECPGLTCATEHGETLFLGYKDGRVDICIVKRFIENFVPEVSLNVQDFHKQPDDDSVYVFNDLSIVGLEVYETKESHHVFIATRSNLYKLSVTYTDDTKGSVLEIKI